MISSSAFDSINLLDKAADASAKRETIIANNIANADTPRYKRKDIDFSKMLMQEMMKLAEPKPVEKTENKYYPREYGIQYQTSYGSLPNYHSVPVEEDEVEAAYGSDFGSDNDNPEIDGSNVGIIAEKLDIDSLKPRVFTEYRGLSYRIDKNNVDPDTENVELASEQIKYQVLTQSISHEFSQLKSVMQS